MEIGAQFYTVRESCKTLADFAETLKKVADIGYRNVQISGTCPYEAEWLREQLQKNGLRCVLTHIPAPRLIDETEQVVHDHEVFGCEHIGLGYYSFNPEQGDTYEKFVETYAPVARKISSMGKTFMYHNHDGEFRKLADGRIVMEHLMEDFPADQLGFTVDTYWVQAGGGDLLTEDGVALADNGHLVRVDRADHADGKTRAGEGLAVNQIIRQSQLLA